MKAKELWNSVLFGGSGGGGIIPSGSKTINVSRNGTTTEDVSEYAEASIVANVPNSYSQADEGKVVSNGALVSQGSTTVLTNGTYDTSTIGSTVVAVDNTYEQADEGKVVSNGELVSQTSATKTENGTYDTTLNNQVVVNVPSTNKEADFIQGSLSGAYQNAQATSVCDYAFKGMTSLTEVSIPNAATVGSLAFSGCSALEKAEVDGATSVANYAFFQLANLEEVSCRNCGSFGTSVFKDCVSLESVVFPKAGVIGKQCFQGCTNLETIDVGGDGYTGLDGRKIGSSAFNNCSSLTALILREQAFVSLDNVDAFTGTPIASGTGYIYVPNVWKSIYQGTQDWASLSSQFRSLEDYTVDGTITGALDPTKI